VPAEAAATRLGSILSRALADCPAFHNAVVSNVPGIARLSAGLHCTFGGLLFYGANPHIGDYRFTAGSQLMSNMKDRENAFENKFAHDEELKFKAEARRNKLLGLWAAELLGKTGDDAETYAKSVVMADFEEAGDEDVFRKVRADFDAGGVEQSDHQLRRKMNELLAVAVEQIQAS